MTDLPRRPDLQVLVLPPVASSSAVRRGHPAGHRRRPARPPPGRDRHRRHRRATSPAGGCSSPAPAGRSAPSCAARCTASSPSELIMLDRDESALHAVQLSIEGRALLDIARRSSSPTSGTGARLRAIFERAPSRGRLPRRRAEAPAAARAASRRGVEDQRRAAPHNVLEAPPRPRRRAASSTSRTDKAADPTSVLGLRRSASAERLTATWPMTSRTAPIVSVRFGNVLGIRGVDARARSQRQIDDGGPVTVTHPDVTRYFMTVEEAVRLDDPGRCDRPPGEVLVLDMGEPVRIVDVAHRLVEQAGRADPHRVHRAAARREAPRRPCRRRRGGRAAVPPADQPGARSSAALRRHLRDLSLDREIDRFEDRGPPAGRSEL